MTIWAVPPAIATLYGFHVVKSDHMAMAAVGSAERDMEMARNAYVPPTPCRYCGAIQRRDKKGCCVGCGGME